MEARNAATDFSDAVPFVNAGIVADHDHVTPKMTQEVSEERTDFVVLDVLRMTLKVQTHSAAPGCDRDSGDDGDTVSAIAMLDERGLAPGRPGLPEGRNQQESRLVDENEVGTQPRSVFFRRGQSLRFQRSIASSSRSRARRSGFW